VTHICEASRTLALVAQREALELHRSQCGRGRYMDEWVGGLTPADVAALDAYDADVAARLAAISEALNLPGTGRPR